MCLCDWLMSPSTVSSSVAPAVACIRIPFLGWPNRVPLCGWTTFVCPFMHPCTLGFDCCDKSCCDPGNQVPV